MRILTLLFLSTILFIACDLNNSSHKEITTENGYQLTILEDKEGEVTPEGGGFKLAYSVYADDSLVQAQQGQDMQYMEMLDTASIIQQKNPILESLLYLSEGDSAIIRQDINEIPVQARRGLTGDYINYHIVMKEVLNKEEFAVEKEKINAQRAEEQARIAELTAERNKFLDSFKSEFDDYVDKYKRGNLDVRKLGAGLDLYIIEEGEGAEINKGDEVVVEYIGRKLDSDAIFDSSFRRAKGIPLRVGAGSVIQGWELGLEAMNRGDKGILFIPAALAYGEEENSDKLSTFNLVFYVEPK